MRESQFTGSEPGIIMTAAQPPNREQLQRRFRALLIIGLLLAPTFCAFPALAVIAQGWLRWLILGMWVLVGAVLGLVITRGLKTLDLLGAERQRE